MMGTVIYDGFCSLNRNQLHDRIMHYIFFTERISYLPKIDKWAYKWWLVVCYY